MATGKHVSWHAPDALLQLTGWARDGLSDEQIAKNIGISRKTYYEWLKQHSDIRDAIKKGKAVVDIEVENALLQRALGYDYSESRIEDGPDGIKTITICKHMPADTTAQIFWLSNRKSDKWRRNPQPDNHEQFEKLDALITGIGKLAESDDTCS